MIRLRLKFLPTDFLKSNKIRHPYWNKMFAGPLTNGLAGFRQIQGCSQAFWDIPMVCGILNMDPSWDYVHYYAYHYMHNYDYDRMILPCCYIAELTLRVGHSNLWIWSNLLNSHKCRADSGQWQKGKSERFDWLSPEDGRGEEKECRQLYRSWEGPLLNASKDLGISEDSHKQLDCTCNQNEPRSEFFPRAFHMSTQPRHTCILA